jgi:plastocyanin
MGGFFPATAVIHAGQSITWTWPKAFVQGGIAFPLTAQTLQASNPQFMMDSNKAPHLILGMNFLDSTVKSGSDFPGDGKFISGLLAPGQSVTLHFPKPGVYQYFSYPNNDLGTVVVLPKGQ